MLYVLNLGEGDAANLHEREREVSRRARWPGGPHRRDRGLRQDRSRAGRTAPAEQADYLASYGLKESGLERLISATYSLLGLMSFLTAGEDECRAWTIPMNSPR
jgi:ribosome-binding ATPase